VRFWIKSIIAGLKAKKVIIMRNWGSRIKNLVHRFRQTVPKKFKRRGSFEMARPGLYLIKHTPIFIIILAFLFNILLPCDYLAWAKKTDTMPSPIGEEKSVGPGQSSLLGPNDVEIPPVFGSVKERFQQDKEPKGLIVHIQDLHTHYQAHKNIASIIKHLARKHDINVILCEAKETDKGLSFFRPWVDKAVREKVAEENLKKGLLTGWEALDLSSDLDLVLQGIEDKGLYMKDMDRFLEAEVFREDALKFVDLLRNIVENLKLHMYTKSQRAFDGKMRSYRDERTGIADYTRYLTKLSDKRNIDHKRFTNLSILLDTLEMEKGINFERAEGEREAIIDILSENLADDEMKVLLEMSMKFKGNHISQNEFYQYLITLTTKLDIDMGSYPNFNLYTRYIATYHELDASKLFEEINNLEDLLADVLFAEEEQKRLFQISKNLIILRGLVDFKLTPDEFDYYDGTKTAFEVENWLEFLRLNSEYFQLTQYVPDDASVIRDNIDTLEKFYKVAHERDEAFVRNIDQQFKERGMKTAILMTGGFHTPGVTRRLKEAGYSYVIISPRIEEEMNYERYHEILKESYRKLRETTVLAAWARSELLSALNELAEELREGILIATPDQERFLFGPRGAIAIITAEGDAILSLRALELMRRGQLVEFLGLIQRMRRERESVTPEEVARLLSLSQIARAPEEVTEPSAIGTPGEEMASIDEAVEAFLVSEEMLSLAPHVAVTADEEGSLTVSITNPTDPEDIIRLSFIRSEDVEDQGRPFSLRITRNDSIMGGGVNNVATPQELLEATRVFFEHAWHYDFWSGWFGSVGANAVLAGMHRRAIEQVPLQPQAEGLRGAAQAFLESEEIRALAPHVAVTADKEAPIGEEDRSLIISITNPRDPEDVIALSFIRSDAAEDAEAPFSLRITRNDAPTLGGVNNVVTPEELLQAAMVFLQHIGTYSFWHEWFESVGADAILAGMNRRAVAETPLDAEAEGVREAAQAFLKTEEMRALAPHVSLDISVGPLNELTIFIRNPRDPEDVIALLFIRSDAAEDAEAPFSLRITRNDTPTAGGVDNVATPAELLQAARAIFQHPQYSDLWPAWLGIVDANFAAARSTREVLARTQVVPEAQGLIEAAEELLSTEEMTALIPLQTVRADDRSVVISIESQIYPGVVITFSMSRHYTPFSQARPFTLFVQINGQTLDDGGEFHAATPGELVEAARAILQNPYHARLWHPIFASVGASNLLGPIETTAPSAIGSRRQAEETVRRVLAAADMHETAASPQIPAQVTQASLSATPETLRETIAGILGRSVTPELARALQAITVPAIGQRLVIEDLIRGILLERGVDITPEQITQIAQAALREGISLADLRQEIAGISPDLERIAEGLAESIHALILAQRTGQPVGQEDIARILVLAGVPAVSSVTAPGVSPYLAIPETIAGAARQAEGIPGRLAARIARIITNAGGIEITPELAQAIRAFVRPEMRAEELVREEIVRGILRQRGIPATPETIEYIALEASREGGTTFQDLGDAIVERDAQLLAIAPQLAEALIQPTETTEPSPIGQRTRVVSVPPARREALRPAQDEYISVVVANRHGIVGVTKARFNERGELVSVPTQERIVGPHEAVEVAEDTLRFIAAPALTREAFEIVGPRIVTRDTRQRLQVSRERARDQLEEIERAGLLRDDTDYVIELDAATIARIAEEARLHGVDILRYLAALMADDIYRLRSRGINVYFEIIGEDGELVREIRSIYEKLLIASTEENIELMRLYDMVDARDKSPNVKRVTIMHESSRQLLSQIKNPKLFLEHRVLEENELGYFDWAETFIAALRMAIEERPKSAAEIQTALADPDSNYSKLREELTRLFVTDEDVTAEGIFHLFDVAAIGSEQDYIDRLLQFRLFIKRIEAINFDQMRELHEMLKEVEFSI